MMTSAQRNFLTGSFNPMSLSPALWLSDTGSDPAVWPDISGNGRNATQATAAAQPAIVTAGLNGRQVRRFDGVDDILSTAAWTSSISVDVFIVGKATNWHRGVTQALASHGYNESFNTGQSYGQIVGSTGGDWVVNDITCYGRGYQGNPRVIAAQPSGSDFRMLNFAMSVSQSFIKINGATISQRVTTTANCTTSTTPFRVGSNLTYVEFWDGDIAEILVFPTALNTTDRQKVEAYLRAKWDIPFNPLLLSPALWLSDTGSDPAVWPDISGNGRNATAGVGQEPGIVAGGLNGRQIRRFDGVNDFLQSNAALATTTATIFSVSRCTDVTVNDRMILQVGTNTLKSSIGLAIHTNRARKAFIYGADNLLGTATTDATLMSCSLNSTGATYYQEGIMTANASLTGVSCGAGFTVGSLRDGFFSTYYKGDIAEILVFPTALSLTDRQNVEAYLKNKWLPDFNPLSLSPALWLSDTGSEPGVWPDISGNARNATQANASQQPAIVTAGLNGRQVRRFDGVNDFLECLSVYNLATLTIIAVSKVAVNSAAPKTVYANGSNAGDYARDGMLYWATNSVNFQRSNGSSFPTATATATVSEFVLVTGQYTGSQLSVAVNGGTPSTITTTIAGAPTDAVTIGATKEAYGYFFHFNGDIAEILVFPTALSDTNRQRVEAYLKNKWLPDFNPLSLSPALWLSDTGSDAGVWTDISGNGRNATQATTGQQPTIVTNVRNGRQIRRFNGTNQRLDVATLDPKTIFAVVNTTTTSTYRSVFGSRSSDAGAVDAVYLQAGIPARTTTFARATIVDTIGASDLIATAGVIGSGVWSIISGVRTDTSIQAFLDGVGGAVDTTVNALKNTTASVIGAAYYNDAIADFWPGDIAEIIIFTTTLSTTDRQAVESYLRTKWGTP